MQILILIALLLSQTCAVAVTIELIARGIIGRAPRTQANRDRYSGAGPKHGRQCPRR
ncbi:hypothetical protein MA5S0422_2397 [Mycobacteroides abscessus 5S-0422]|uniref:Uncharacterized protein n=1 Tax=Mycobacteroides abscessus subsp. bolletii 1513 TaxID=1299321 RepID=X8DUY0_9MYCO|nr:hypothetical protein MA5S0304_1463 [Mycobacteroides abscessus 5S-0304]EIU14358.1 hypothetical protein MA5S0421_1715 [Mycobacteroides abscessus 5S-0421]EIU15102.1 hypothetical protein MA5S0422_2397 [Mycobacteroides abscessus 5S-0422]EIU26919.1 hypothetical protein MA5S0708_1940 [Mycobacteroides abscessus 5S-0708]EIU27291.1 hypothetical protein MA5S0817_1495 [Mycobacteroides abscessus 5S-0817]EIU31494.1 hypothetical protein MA5S1212_4959 [Mycobacteroides abscessus 5S-1212]EIU49858.1 hypothet